MKLIKQLLIRPFAVLTIRAKPVEAQAAFRQAQGKQLFNLHKVGSISTALIVICCLFADAAWARGHGGRFGGWRPHSHIDFYFGGPVFPYPYYRYPSFYPYYYPPTIVTVPSTPPVYIEQTPPAAREYPAGYWYYCSNPDGYYPYIKDCPTGWQQVDPTPPSPR